MNKKSGNILDIHGNTFWILLTIVVAIGIFPIQRWIGKAAAEQERFLLKEILRTTFEYQVNDPDTTFFFPSWPILRYVS